METFSRIVLALSWLLGIVLLTLWRLGFDLLLTSLRRRGMCLTRVLIVGEDEFGRSFHRLLCDNPELGYLPVGYLATTGPEELRGALQGAAADEVMAGGRGHRAATSTGPDGGLSGGRREAEHGADVVPRAHQPDPRP